LRERCNGTSEGRDRSRLLSSAARLGSRHDDAVELHVLDKAAPPHGRPAELEPEDRERTVDGVAVRVEPHDDLGSALAAAGLSASDLAADGPDC
jgi:hypothetical protein